MGFNILILSKVTKTNVKFNVLVLLLNNTLLLAGSLVKLLFIFFIIIFFCSIEYKKG